MTKKNWIIVAVAAAVIVLSAVGLIFGFLPYHWAASAMPEGEVLILNQTEEGALRLCWPTARDTDFYRVQVMRPAKDPKSDPQLMWQADITDGTECILQQARPGDRVQLRVFSGNYFNFFGQRRMRIGKKPMEVVETLDMPVISDLQWTADPATKTVRATFQMAEGDVCHCSLREENGALTQFRSPDNRSMTVSFGSDGDLPMPEYSQSCRLAFDACRLLPGLELHGAVTAEMTVVREDLLGRDLNLRKEDLPYNRTSLRWDETKGAHYEVQLQREGEDFWSTVATVDREEERFYESPHMPAFQDFLYRVVAVGGQTEPDSEFAAVSDVMPYVTVESPIYCTVWPTKDLEAYTDTDRTAVGGTAKVSTAYCVLDEQNGMFAVDIGGQTLYIDSNYCMINLPEYIGDRVAYNITNSYSSIYMVHEYAVKGMTDNVIIGYENVNQGYGEYLVPLLYPTAQKLLDASDAALELGYRLKIYDSFRPYVATRHIYDLTERAIKEPLPERTHDGRVMTDLPKVEDGEELTYEMVMVSPNFGLPYFLARGASCHNMGIAMDITMEDLATGQEIRMQTSIHDLTSYSVVYRNNASANALAGIMKGAGFADLVSEWWHFQDNEARSALQTPTVWAGISAKCWMKDDFGWKYRTAKGGYLYDTLTTIDGVEYQFDSDGYLMAG